MAISWTHREDYGRAGFAMLSVRDSDGRAVGRQAVLYSVLLLIVSVLPSFLGMAGAGYLVAAAGAGAALLITSIKFLHQRSATRARSLFMTSNVYLLVVMALLVTLVRA
jgi:heme o synthase